MGDTSCSGTGCMFRPRGKERGGGGNWLNMEKKRKEKKKGGWLIAPVAFASCLPFLPAVLVFLFPFSVSVFLLAVVLVWGRSHPCNPNSLDWGLLMIIVGGEPKIMQGPRRTGSHANVEEGARNEACRPEDRGEQQAKKQRRSDSDWTCSKERMCHGSGWNGC